MRELFEKNEKNGLTLKEADEFIELAKKLLRARQELKDVEATHMHNTISRRHRNSVVEPPSCT